jgi:predicted transcriptional regulator
MKQTAVEQFAIALYEGGFLQGNGDEINDLLEKAKEMEKEQIEDAELRGKEIIIIKHTEHKGGNK